MSDDMRKYRYSYRLFIKEEGSRNAVQISTKLTEGDPVTIQEAEKFMKDAVERLADDIIMMDSKSTRPNEGKKA